MAIIDLVQSNDIETLDEVLKQNTMSTEEICDKQQNTPLHIAAMKGNADIVSLLLKNGANLNQFNKRYLCPAQIAINHNKLEVLKIMLYHDPSIANKVNKNGDSLLMVATSKGHIEIVSNLLKFHADSSLRNKDGNTALHHAAQRNRGRIIQLLVKSNKNCLDIPNKKGYTALHIGASKGYEEIARVLLLEGANRKLKAFDGKTAYMLGTEKVKMVFKAYMDYKRIEQSCICGMGSLLGNKIFEGGQSALHIAASFPNSKRLTRQLCENSSYINASNYEKMTPLHVAVATRNIENADVILRYGGNVNQTEGKNGNTALHLACINNDVDCIRMLLKHNADLAVRNNEGLTPIMFAVKYHVLTVADFLIENGADLTAKDSVSNSLLHQSVITNSPHISEILVQKNPKWLRAINKEGETPLILAVKLKHAFLVSMFLEHGANGSWKNSYGISAYSLANKMGDQKLLDCFQKTELKN